MSSTTSRVSLYKPAGGEDINVTTDLNNNYDKLDTNLNFRVVANAAARNAISPFWAGLNVRETDTGKLYVSNGSAPISGSWKQIPVADANFDADLDMGATNQVNVGGSASPAAFSFLTASSSNGLTSSRVTGDSQNRFAILASGVISWGSGALAADTNLYRSTANTLKTDDNLEVALNANVAGDTVLTGNLTVGGVGQVQYATTGTNRTVSATAVAAITNMTVAVVANATYVFTAQLFLDSASTFNSDLKVGFVSPPASSTISFSGNGVASALLSGTAGTGEYAAVVSGTTATVTYGMGTSDMGLVLQGVIITGGTSGNLSLAAGLSATGSNATVYAPSYLMATRVA